MKAEIQLPAHNYYSTFLLFTAHPCPYSFTLLFFIAPPCTYSSTLLLFTMPPCTYSLTLLLFTAAPCTYSFTPLLFTDGKRHRNYHSGDAAYSVVQERHDSTPAATANNRKLFQLDIHTHRLLKTPQRSSATGSSHSDAACSQTWLIVYDLFSSLQKLQTWKEDNYAFFVPTEINHIDINYATARPKCSTQQLHPGQATVNSHDIS